MSSLREKIPIEVKGFFKQQRTESTIQSNDIEYVSNLDTPFFLFLFLFLLLILFSLGFSFI
ncbi:hypothetical protein ACS0TY_000546 [Phlomoides rotata]